MQSIKTERLILRTFSEFDYDDLYEFLINRDYRQNGYATEALCAVIGRLFSEGVHRVYAKCDPRNVRSWKLLEKVGMRREAHLKENVWFHKDENGNPIWKDTYIYALTAREATARQNPEKDASGY